MFEESKVEKFYDEYGIKEWNRLGGTAYGRLMFILHTDFLDDFIGEGKRVLDAGCGPGRYSIHAAKRKSRVTLLDLSQNQLDIAKQKCREAGVTDYIDGYIHTGITEMKEIADNSFDTVVCYGAPLNYLHGETPKAISELIRVTKNGGEILISVNSRYGVFNSLAIREQITPEFLSSFWGDPEVFGIYEMLETGNEPAEYPGKKHPTRHFFNAAELKELLNRKRLTDIELGAVPCVITGAVGSAERFYADSKAWDTLLNIEKTLYKSEYILDSGEFLLARASVRKG